MNQTTTIQMGNGLTLFEGETFLHLGKKHTFNHVANAILDKMSKVDAECLIMTLKKNMKEPKFLKQEEKLEALFKSIREEKK